MEAIKNIKMVEAARNEASKIINKDSNLKKHKAIRERLELNKDIHFE